MAITNPTIQERNFIELTTSDFAKYRAIREVYEDTSLLLISDSYFMKWLTKYPIYENP